VRETLSLGRVAGIKVGINWSALAIVVLIVAGLASGQLPAQYPGRSPVEYVATALVAAVLFLASLLAHEIAHAVVARRNGVEVHSIVLWLLGGVAQLDGGRVLRAALWRWRGDREAAAVTAARAGRVFGFGLVGLGLLETLVTGTFSGVWLALIGWFLISAATAEEQQARMGSRLSGVLVGDVMTEHPVMADATMTLEEFVDRLAMSHRFSCYPLVDHSGRLTGLVTLNRVRAVPPNRRSDTRLRDIACPPEGVPTAHPDEPLLTLLPRMRGCTDGRAVVLDEHDRVIGVVSSTDISRALQLADLRSFHAYPPPHGADLTTIGPGR